MIKIYGPNAFHFLKGLSTDIDASLHRAGDFLPYSKLFDQCLMMGFLMWLLTSQGKPN